MQTQAEVKNVVKGRECYVSVAGTETYVRVSQAAVLYLRACNDDESKKFHFRYHSYFTKRTKVIEQVYIDVEGDDGWFDERAV